MNTARLSHKVSLCSLLLGLACAPVWAQTTAPTKEMPAEEIATLLPEQSALERTRLLRLRNVKPSLLAYWLDAAHHQAPPEFRPLQLDGGAFSRLSRLPRLPGNGNGPLDLKLPLGIESLVAIDPQNTLVVRGTKEGLDALVALLPTIDVPITQYEIEARFVQIDRSTLAAFGLKFPQSGEQSPYSFGSVIVVPPANALWDRQMAGNTGGKVLSAPRVLVVDGLQGSLQQTTFTPLILDDELARQQRPHPTPDPMSAPLNQVSPPDTAGTAMVSSGIGIHTVLIRRPNDLITLGITPTFGTRTLTVETTLHEDQKIAIQMSPPKDKKQLIVFVKVTRVRRAGEE